MRRAAIGIPVAVTALDAVAPALPSYHGRRCTPPSGHRITDCRTAAHGTPDLSRAAWRALRGAEVTISEPIDSLAPDAAAGGATEWPLVDSLGQPPGRLVSGGVRPFTLLGSDGSSSEVSVGGIARGMVRVGTPVAKVAKVDAFSACDPNSDGTLTWRYWSIHTGITARPRIYGWIPGNCPTR